MADERRHRRLDSWLLAIVVAIGGITAAVFWLLFGPIAALSDGLVLTIFSACAVMALFRLPGFRDWESGERFVGEPALLAGEHLVWRMGANHSQGPVRSVGGRLFLTERRLAFVPNVVDTHTGGQAWVCHLAEIRSVGIEPRNPRDMSGGIRKRLRIESSDGAVDLFVVNHLNRVIPRIQDAVRGVHEG